MPSSAKQPHLIDRKLSKKILKNEKDMKVHSKVINFRTKRKHSQKTTLVHCLYLVNNHKKDLHINERYVYINMRGTRRKNASYLKKGEKKKVVENIRVTK